MRIAAPAEFHHVGNLKGLDATRDPRHLSFFEKEIEIDLRECKFIDPPALLWCLTYPLVAQPRAMKVVVRLPDDPTVLSWLVSLGLPVILKSRGIDVAPADPGVGAQGLHLVLPLTCFRTAADAEDVTARVDESLARLGFGAPNVRPLVGLIFSEVALNAVYHAESSVAAYGFVQFYRRQQRELFVLAVADGGIGIRESLRTNPAYRNLGTDAIAIAKALQERVSRFRESNRGLGLHWVNEELARSGGRLVLHSMRGSLFMTDGAAGRARGARLFPGTEVCAWVPT